MKLVSSALRALVSKAAVSHSPAGKSFRQSVTSIFAASAFCLAGFALAPMHAGAQTIQTDDNFHYDNSWEISGGLVYAYLPSGPSVVPRTDMPGLNVAATQWIFPRWGATGDYRAYVGLGDTNTNHYGVNSPLFVENFISAGAEYRWVRTPAIGVSLHALAGGGYGVFNYHVPGGVTNGQIGVYPNGGTFDVIGGANIDFNTASGLGVRVSPDAFVTDFGGNLRTSFSITTGVVWRFGHF